MPSNFCASDTFFADLRDWLNQAIEQSLFCHAPALADRFYAGRDHRPVSMLAAIEAAAAISNPHGGAVEAPTAIQILDARCLQWAAKRVATLLDHALAAQEAGLPKLPMLLPAVGGYPTEGVTEEEFAAGWSP